MIEKGAELAGRYTLVSPLGRGTNGEVWEALDQLSGTPVALKLLNLRDEEDEQGVGQARVRREVAALRLLRLPGVGACLVPRNSDEVPTDCSSGRVVVLEGGDEVECEGRRR